MKTLSVEVPNGIYAVYMNAPEEQKRAAELEVSNLLKILFSKKLKQAYFESADVLRSEAQENGLTDDIVNNILAEIDSERTAEVYH
ncbi:hypothetical protein Emtol_2252 [Emticicia oligotrophica DSM 17448]|uniref:CopG family transcriptional regulator n=1 Tax=Emticicia oligotrophica (strain DSM 17448 / CIP 109782 / MTCC 6937 / GPTSA100-15) TaxID=929562 RepID=A0ABN4AM96_EMTOG|nr:MULTISPECIES: hypothetical protein [Emticicia]AFK03390.1 hypothetical protein Emtol_2252 [Emticicia oligotrophica DSM 17448]